MGLIEKLMGFVFGGGVQATVEVFRENSEKSAVRAEVLQQTALNQFATEFRSPRFGFDSFIDGVNRLPRSAMAFGCWTSLSRKWSIPFGLPIAWRAYRLYLNPYGGYWARSFPFIFVRIIKAKALKFVPKKYKNKPESLHRPFKQTR